MGWGKKIAILYIGFVVMVLGMVFFTMNIPVELVSENYYSRGIDYQKHLDKINRTKALSKTTEIVNKGDYVEIKFPNLPDLNKTRDVILFYKPSESGRDLKTFIEPDSLGYQKISTSGLSKGFWRIKISWTSNGTEYYSEGMINIP